MNDGSGFRTIVGGFNNQVLKTYSIAFVDIIFRPGNRYYFEVFIYKGAFVKIGVA